MNILLIDDEHLEVEQLEYLISPHFPNWTIFKAYDASQALQIAKKTKIELIFLDIHMPGKSGLELAKDLKALYKTRIVMVTAYQSFEFAQKAIRIGVEDYLTKPIIEDDLMRVINKYDHWNSKDSTIQSALDIIHENYSEKLTVNDIAKKIFINPSYLSRKFLETQKIGLNEYLNRYRLEKVTQLLASEKEHSISEVAEKCGFNSQHYLSVAFKKKFGITPREYRLRSRLGMQHENS